MKCCFVMARPVALAIGMAVLALLIAPPPECFAQAPVAKAIGVTMPPIVPLQADRVIE